MNNIALSGLSKSMRLHIIDTDMMHPTFDYNDAVVIDLSDTCISFGGVFALYEGDTLIIRRLEPVPHSNPPAFDMKSDNENYSCFRVLGSDIDVAGRITWKVSRVSSGGTREAA